MLILSTQIFKQQDGNTRIPCKKIAYKPLNKAIFTKILNEKEKILHFFDFFKFICSICIVFLFKLWYNYYHKFKTK